MENKDIMAYLAFIGTVLESDRRMFEQLGLVVYENSCQKAIGMIDNIIDKF